MENRKFKFSTNISVKYIFIFCGTNNLEHNPPKELVNGIILSWISAKKTMS